MTDLLHVPVVNLMELWGELVEAYHGVNDYGSDTAEFYAYRFNPDSPIRRCVPCQDTALRRQENLDASRQAANALHDLVKLFCDTYDCGVLIDDKNAFAWWNDTKDRFDHRARVKIVHQRDMETRP